MLYDAVSYCHILYYIILCYIILYFSIGRASRRTKQTNTYNVKILGDNLTIVNKYNQDLAIIIY